MFPRSNCESSQNGQGGRKGGGGMLSLHPLSLPLAQAPPPPPWKDEEGQTNFGMHGVPQGQVTARLACYILRRETLRQCEVGS